jgi:hypothetical protein
LRLRNGQLASLTEPHTFDREMIAKGRATAYLPPRTPRRVTAEDIRLDRLRAGVPVRAALEVDVDGHRWTWQGHAIDVLLEAGH